MRPTQSAVDLARSPIAVPPHRTTWAIPLSVLAHTGLLLTLVIGVAWKSEPPPALQAELWELTPASAAAKPQAVTEPKVEPIVQKPPPTQSSAPIPNSPDRPDRPDREAIAPTLIKKPLKQTLQAPPPATKAAKPKAEPAPKPTPKTTPAPTAPREPKPSPAPDTSAADVARRREITRMNQLSQSASLSSSAAKPLPSTVPSPAVSAPVSTQSSPPTNSGAPVVGTPQTGSPQGLGAGWGAKLKACVQPNLRYSDSGGENLRAVFVVALSAGGAPSDPVLSRSSGNAAFDTAVSRALLRCDPFPKPESGGYPASVTVAYRLND